jgi:hypothetical protein
VHYGCCSGDTIAFEIGSTATLIQRASSSVDGAPIVVEYVPGGTVMLTVPEHGRHMAATLQEAEMLERHGDGAVLAFAIGLGTRGHNVTISRC